MPETTVSDVLIAGAGPVGLTLAIDLAWRGIDVTVVERRTIAHRSSPMTGQHPAYTMDSHKPSTVPGCRTPHLWCEDGSSLYDEMGPEFTLPAARNRGVPLKLLDIERPTANGRHFLWRRTGIVAAGPARSLARQ